jgi:protocatechuate 3,4-dioxygenase beta subunit
VKVTDATGAFELTAPPDASFRVTAEAQGFVDGKSAAMTGAAGARVECEPISLSRGATVEGIVTTPEGGPAEGVEISWKREADPDDPMSFLAGFMGERGGKEPAAATTGADGAFRMHGVPPGKVTVTFKAAGFRPLTRPQVATKDGETARLDVTLDRGAVVTGRVVDETGAGVAGARVSCSLKQAPLLGEEDDTKTFGSTESQDEGGTAESGADGSFRIEGVAPGEHVVRAGAKGLHLAKPVEANADGDPVTVRMLRGLAISGIVRCDGKPAQGVRVSASPQGGAADNGTGFEEFDPEEMDVDAGAIDVLFPGTRIATTRADGTFEIENLAPGKYTVTAKPRPAHLRAIGVGGSEAAREEGERAAHPTEIVRTAVKDVAAGSHDLVIDCAPGLAIAGSVLLADGSTPKDGTVSVERAGVVEMPPDDEGEDGADDFDEEDWDLSNIDLGDDGTFRVAGLGAGQYVVTVEVPGAGRVRTVAEAGKTDLKLRLRPAGAVTGRIVLPGGRSAGKVWFELRRDGAKPGEPEESDFNVTDRAGKFDLKGVAEGPWTIAVEDHGAGGRRWIGTATLTVRAGETTKVPDLVLRDAGPAEDDEEDE